MAIEQHQIFEKIRGNLSQRRSAIRDLAVNTQLKNEIFKYVFQNKGNAEDARMIFHDSIIAFVKRVFTDHDFVLTTEIEFYIIGISKKLWLSKLRKDKNNPILHADDINIDNEPVFQAESMLESSEKKVILHKILDHLHAKCKEVLMYWAGGYTMEEIAKLCGYKSEGMARKKKSMCFKALMGWLQDHPEYLNELKK